MTDKERIAKYEQVLMYIITDYIELSYEKAQNQRDHWRAKVKAVWQECWDENEN